MALLLGATAGVRALPAADQAALMAAAKAAIVSGWAGAAGGDGGGGFGAGNVRCEVLSGSTEAAEEWLAANYLHGALGFEAGAAGGGGAAAAAAAAEGTVAVLGMGGSSTQLSFAEPAAAAGTALVGLEGLVGGGGAGAAGAERAEPNEVRVALAGLPPTTLYAVSFPGLGQSAARAATDAQVVRDAAAAAGGGGSAAPHPCLLHGYSEPAAPGGGGERGGGTSPRASLSLSADTHRNVLNGSYDRVCI